MKNLPVDKDEWIRYFLRIFLRACRSVH
jgi:hypothetical protein